MLFFIIVAIIVPLNVESEVAAMLLFYIRHGDPIYSPDSLTPLGLAQADAVKKRLGQFGIEKIYSSDSTRAVLTATPTAEMLNLEINLLPWCNESLAWKDLTVQYAEGKFTWAYSHLPTKIKFATEEVRLLGKKWYEHPDFKDTSFKKGMERIQGETDKLMLELGFRHDGKNNVYLKENPKYERVALFAHEGFGAAFMSCLLDIPYPEISNHTTMQHSGISVIEFDEAEDVVIPRILQYSNDSHLFAERLPLDYQHRIRF